MVLKCIVLYRSDADEPAADVLRRADVGPRLVHGPEHHTDLEGHDGKGPDNPVYHPPAVLRGVRYL